jgi:hypothetical protein
VAIRRILESAVPADLYPVRWANLGATEVADRVAVEMEFQAHHEEERRVLASYLASMVSEMRGRQPLLTLCPPPEDKGQGRRSVKLSREAVCSCTY